MLLLLLLFLRIPDPESRQDHRAQGALLRVSLARQPFLRHATQ
jgi:hypothetical protein